MREPRVPMLPSELPQQRIVAVAELEPRPQPFDAVVGYGVKPSGVQLANGPSNPDYICQVEWAWSPFHSRLDAYYLSKGRSHWMLWSYWYDDNWGRWNWLGIGHVPRGQATNKQAAIHLLADFWKLGIAEEELDRFHWINESGLLTISEVTEIGRLVWSGA
ncbi:hypothetical protein [Altererythrobacter sp. GH1-8]|uniref:hypothetical protein n=1 Tax=Altererythrobacter sp. GH1-8 TaxID=3349333 RepID=UPI00374CB63A